jgi:hypothetical protein
MNAVASSNRVYSIVGSLGTVKTKLEVISQWLLALRIYRQQGCSLGWMGSVLDRLLAEARGLRMDK